jgi:hypothetical protein
LTWFLVAWVTWSCPFRWALPTFPQKLKGHICDEGVEAHAYSRLSDAKTQVSDLGQNARPRLFVYHGLRREELPVTFKP